MQYALQQCGKLYISKYNISVEKVGNMENGVIKAVYLHFSKNRRVIKAFTFFFFLIRNSASKMADGLVSEISKHIQFFFQLQPNWDLTLHYLPFR